MQIVEINKKKKQRNYEREILNYVNYTDYIKGRNYYNSYITLELKDKEHNITNYYFDVESERTYDHYDCIVAVDTTGKIIECSCTCMQYASYESCKHLAACLYNYQEDIFTHEIDEKELLDITKNVFKYFTENSTTKKVRRQLNINLNITTESTFDYSNDTGLITLEIGEKKLYKCGKNKLTNLLDAIENEQEFYLGKTFTYIPEENYFSEEDKELIDYLQTIKEASRYGYQAMTLKRNSIKILLKKLQGRKFTLNGYNITKIENKYPLSTTLNKKEDNYNLSFNDIEDIEIVTGDLEYVQINSALYHLNKKDRDLLQIVLENDLNNMMFSKNDIDKFSRSILPTIKNQIEIDEQISDIIITSEPTPKMYFDLYRDKIICNLKFDYDGTTIDYFDKVNNILRDEDYETKIIEEIYAYNFEIVKNKIKIEELEDMAYFLEEGLKDLA